MTQLNVLNGLVREGGRLGVYTIETSGSIPTYPGCYAWFLPLWFYSDEFDKLISTICGFLSYEPGSEKATTVDFTRDRLDIHLSKSPIIRLVDEYRQTWNDAISDPLTRESLQETFLQASLLMPPLYVGRTDNLQRRYGEHVKGNRERNDFNARFSSTAKELGVNAAVSDLLFACVRTGPTETQPINPRATKLIEHMLLRFWQPPFSIR